MRLKFNFFNLVFVLFLWGNLAPSWATEEPLPSALELLFQGKSQAVSDLKGAGLSCKEVGAGLFQCTPSGGELNYAFSAPLDLIEDQHEFFGLASYYNGSNLLKMDSAGVVEYLEDTAEIPLSQNPGWVGWRGRFNIFMLSASDAEVRVEKDKFFLKLSSADPFLMYLGDPSIIHNQQTGSAINFTPIKFSHLWGWLKAMCEGVEWLLYALNPFAGGSWGLTILLMAVAIKLLMLPFSLLTVKYQRQVSQYQMILEPKLKAIKEKFDGEEAHKNIMAEYKTLNISPFYTLKPMVGSLIQVPVLIAVFNALGEFQAFDNSSFLWISNLAYPDTIWVLPSSIYLFGNEMNLLPILMTVMTIFSNILFQNTLAPAPELAKQKRNLYFMAFAFFVLFYPFPAAMVLFWTLTNLLQFVQQQFIKI